MMRMGAGESGRPARGPASGEHPRGGLPASREYPLLVAGGILLALAFPPVGFVPAAFLGLIPFLYVLRRRRITGLWSAFRPGLVAGLSFFGPLLYWLIFLSSDQMDNPVLMSGPLVLLVLLQSLYWGLFSAGAFWVRDRTGAPAWLYAPLLWVACEQLRSLFVLGFTWGALGYAGVDVDPTPAQFASVTGVFGVSFWMVLVNALVLEALLARGGRRLRLSLAGVVVYALPWIHGLLVLGAGLAPDMETRRVAVVQPNIPAERKWDEDYKDETFGVLTGLTRAAGTDSLDLVVWPETAAPSYLLREPAYLELVSGASAEAGAPILTGCPDLQYDEETNQVLPRNSVLLVLPGGEIADRYDKIHLVPFGEAIPFQSVFPALRRVDFGEADFAPGEVRTVFESSGARFSALICFESTFPRLARQFVVGGSELLVNVTNDVWYGRTSMPFQHAAMAIMRSIENRRSLVRSANSGISLVTDPFGRVVARLGIFQRGVLVEDVPLVRRTTFYSRYGDLFPWSCLALSVALAAVPALSRRRRILH
ncbi:MAG: apolipoprotein N-acyltransferase [Candidatus Eisenbacteria bacterium]|nr:apolipoprotein N-acyltransferase [Candidatus Eisenbacteria bacterium]